MRFWLTCEVLSVVPWPLLSCAAEMNRHHYSLYVHNCRLILLLRQEPSEAENYKPAEFHWKLDQVSRRCSRHGQNCRLKTDAESDLSSSLFVIGVWQRVASLCVEYRVPHRGSFCRWNYVWAIPGYRGLPTARLQNRNSAYSRCLLAR